jgi:hypothetical protein
MGDYEDIMLKFVEARIPKDKWKALASRYAILEKIEDEDEDEMKNALWDLFLQKINWVTVLTEIQLQVQNDDDDDEEKTDTEEEETDEEN